MTHPRLGLFVLILGLSGCTQMDGSDLMLTAADVGVVRRKVLAPIAPTSPLAAPERDDLPGYGAGPVSEIPKPVVLARAEPPEPKEAPVRATIASFGMTQMTSPLMDLANMADWSGYKTKRYLPPSMTLTIISLDEIRRAMIAELHRC